MTDLAQLLKELEDGLDGVTPGEWSVFIADDGGQWTGWPLSISSGVIEDKCIVRPGGFYPYEWDAKTSQHEACRTAAHIARCSPDTIRALLTRLRETEEARERAERERDEARANARKLRRTIQATHKRPVKHTGCELTHCYICEGGLFQCADCGAAEIEAEERICTAAEAERARLRGELAGGWRVKPLVWEATGETDRFEDQYRAISGSLRHTVEPFFENYGIRPSICRPGMFSLRFWVGNNGLSGISGDFPTLEAAKAAAQADYEARIRAAIEPLPAQETEHG